ncbi:MAG TPA: tetratricopeptide repeat protein, partial [Thermomicrobiales bacterium]|nr:tetratricopeptide repeat protein [Thermomicrobiales bacterium]
VTVLKSIEPLVDQSLLYQVADHTGEPRFRMLEPIREFGLEHLASHGEERAARDAHAAWCLALGERTFAVLRGSGRSQWFDLVETELGNLRAAFTWLAAQDRVEDGVDLGMGFFFFHTRGYHSEAFALFEGFLRHPRIARRTRSRAKALLGHGILVEHLGDLEQALEQMLESVDIFREVGDPVHTGLALVNVGIAYQQLSDFDRAEEANREVLAIGRETNDTWLFKAGLNNLGTVLNDRGQVDRAVPLFEEALAMDRLVDDVYGIELALLNLAEVFLMQEEHERAEPLIQEAFGLLAGLGHRSDLSAAKMLLAQIDRARGDYAAAIAHLEDALVTVRSIDDKVKIAPALLALGDIARLQGDVAGATQQFREGIALSQQIGNRAAVVEGLDGVAGVAVATGAMHQAARLLAAADALLERIRTSRPAGARSRDYENHVRAAREAMDNDAFTATQSEGRALTTDAAVAEALAFAPDPNPMPVMPVREAHGLTARERDVLRLLASGHSNEQIGEELFISHRTVTTHLTAIFTKLKVSSRSAAAVYAIRHELA